MTKSSNFKVLKNVPKKCEAWARRGFEIIRLYIEEQYCLIQFFLNFFSQTTSYFFLFFVNYNIEFFKFIKVLLTAYIVR